MRIFRLLAKCSIHDFSRLYQPVIRCFSTIVALIYLLRRRYTMKLVAYAIFSFSAAGIPLALDILPIGRCGRFSPRRPPNDAFYALAPHHGYCSSRHHVPSPLRHEERPMRALYFICMPNRCTCRASALRYQEHAATQRQNAGHRMRVALIIIGYIFIFVCLFVEAAYASHRTTPKQRCLFYLMKIYLSSIVTLKRIAQANGSSGFASLSTRPIIWSIDDKYNIP